MANKCIAYYRKFGGADFRQRFASLTHAKQAMLCEKDSDFEYFNLCMICEDGSEEIICSNVDKVKEL